MSIDWGIGTQVKLVYLPAKLGSTEFGSPNHPLIIAEKLLDGYLSITRGSGQSDEVALEFLKWASGYATPVGETNYMDVVIREREKKTDHPN